MRRPLGAVSKTVIVALLFAMIVVLQYDYDRLTGAAARPQALAGGPSPEFVRIIDLGFHSTLAATLWAGTMPEILDLFRGNKEYFPDLQYLTSVDPAFGYPYAFSVLTIPAVPSRLWGGDASDTVALEIGKQGLQYADPDWRIPYYMAIDEYLDAKNNSAALTYFDMAGRTPGVPDYAERFALNFGIGTNERSKTEELWQTIASSTNDEATKERAEAYVARLQIFDFLEEGAKLYYHEKGKFPNAPDDLVAAGIINAVPPDPFGFTFVFRPGGQADIDTLGTSTVAPPPLQQLEAPK